VAVTIPKITLTDLQQSMAVVDAQGRPTPVFLRFINDSIRSLKDTVNALADVQNATDAANAAAEAAAAAADTANTAADAATSAATATARDQALVNSYISPASVLSSDTTTITIAAHTRYYADGSSVSVGGGAIGAMAPTDVDYVSYSDPSRAGGAVTYAVSTTAPAQTGDTHVVGAVTVPAIGTQAGGDGPRYPGFVEP
jgi:hypothetical protein